jgi:hypothetical protein
MGEPLPYEKPCHVFAVGFEQAAAATVIAGLGALEFRGDKSI